MKRFNLWVTKNSHSKIICYGSLQEMNDIALSDAITGVGDVHVLPDDAEPCNAKGVISNDTPLLATHTK